MDSLIEALQSIKEYTVTEIGPDGENTCTIHHFRAINSKHNEGQVVEEISTADVVTCAVGPKVLKFIAPVIAKGLNARKKDYPAIIIACENAIMATDTLKGFITEKLEDSTKVNIDKVARFANCAIDRIVPNQEANAGMNVKIEKFHEWCVETKSFAGIQRPEIRGVHYVDDLSPYIERKLFTVNTSHATAAYYGYNRGKKYVHEAMADPAINEAVRGCLRETANLIVKKHGIDSKEQNEYVDKIVERISNPALQDVVERVGRAPMRKLGRNERFVAPAADLATRGESCSNLVAAMEMALRFQNVEGDDESVELAKILKENDAPTATEKITSLEHDHPLFKSVQEQVNKVQESAKVPVAA